MADELSIKVKAELDVKDLEKQVPKDLKNKLKLTIDTTTAATAIKNIQASINALKNNNTVLNLDVTNALSQVQSVADAIRNLSNIKVSSLGQQTVSPNIDTSKIGTADIGKQTAAADKYAESLQRAVDNYNKVFNGANSKVESTSITKNLDGGTSALVKFNNELGQTSQVMFRLQAIMDDTTGEKIGEEWVPSVEKVAENFKKASAEIEKTLSDISNARIKLNQIESTAFTGNNQLTGASADEMRERIATMRDLLDAEESIAKVNQRNLASGDMPLGTFGSGFKDDLKKRLADLELYRKEQEKLLYQQKDLSASTTADAVSGFTSDISKLENGLKESGTYTDQFKQKIQQLKNDLTTVGQSGGKSIQEIQSQWRALNSEISAYKSSTAGQADMLANTIGTGQLADIQNLLSMPGLQGNTIGIEGIKAELDSLAQRYQSLLSELNAGGVTDDRFAQIKTEVEGLDNALNATSKSAEKFNGEFLNNQKLDKAAQGIEKLSLRMQSLKQDYAQTLADNPDLAASVDDLTARIQNADAQSLGNLSAEFSTLSAQVKLAAGESLSFSQIMRNLFGSVGGYLASFVSAARIIQTGVKTIKNMVNEVKGLDTALVDLQKVTGLSGSELDNFTDKAFSMGKEVGRTGTDVIDATATFSRAGYDLAESEALAKSALVMKNVGVDIASTAEAASDMISILRAYDIAAEDSMGLIDKLYNVSNKQPLDFGNLTQMLTTAGGTLAQSGTSIEESMALLTGGFATMRDTSVANGLIMISQRLRAVNEDGEAIDGLMPKLEKDFNKFGSSIMDENGNLRSTYDLLSDLAGAWDTLSSKQRQAIGEDVAGKLYCPEL